MALASSTSSAADEAALALRPVSSYLEDLKSQGHYFHDTAPLLNLKLSQ
jgi:hypothetical protein